MKLISTILLCLCMTADADVFFVQGGKVMTGGRGSTGIGYGFGSVVPPVPSVYDDAVIWYKFNLGDELADSGTSGSTLVNSGGAGFSDGSLHPARTGTDSSTFLRCNKASTNMWLASADGSNYTFSAWSRMTLPYNNVAIRCTWSAGVGASTRLLGFSAAGNYNTAPYGDGAINLVNGADTQSFKTINGVTPPLRDKWVNMILSVTNNVPTYYLDGVQVATSNNTLTKLVNQSFWVLGQRSDLRWGWIGGIDDWAVWQRALSPTEATNVYTTGRSTLSPVVAATNDPRTDAFFLYEFTDGASTADSGTGTNTLTTVFGAIITNNYASFDGVDDYLECLKPSTNYWFSGNNGSNLTVNFWVKLQEALTAQAVHYPFSVKGESTTHFDYGFAGNTYSEHSFMPYSPYISLNRSGHISPISTASNMLTTVMMTNDWNMFSVVIDQHSANLYTNGVLSPLSFNALGQYKVPKVSLWQIGRRQDNYWHIKGFMDDVGAWTRSLSREEIKRLYDLGRSE